MGISAFTIEPLAGKRGSRRTEAGVLPRQIEKVTTLKLLSEMSFQDLLSIERKRSERSRKPFVLMLASAEHNGAHNNGDHIPPLASAITSTTRDTDITGWYSEQSVIGTIFTELGEFENGSFEKFRDRVRGAVTQKLPAPLSEAVKLQFFHFPEQWSGDKPGQGHTTRLYPEVDEKNDSRKLSLIVKRGMDIAGSLLALLVFSPLFLAIAVAIKLTSPGPVFFRQERVGQLGRLFSFLKFRTMRADNDPKIHQEYVSKLIRGEVAGTKGKVFKITADPRVTRVGRFLRKTSLDELPQFFNVLKGEMSLVGPRPPIPYEIQAYDLWHRRRVLEAKPGITGLWQVRGRSRTTFDEMVRLDLQYAKSWSLWLDLRILLETPRAVFSGKGAY